LPTGTLRLATFGFVALFAGTAHADPDEPFSFHLGGYLQPQARLRQNSAASGDEDGFRIRRARLIATAKTKVHDVEISTTVEGELSPQFALLDAYGTAKASLPGDGSWRVDAGQVKAPFSRQDLLSDSVLAFVEKPELASLAPDRQVGVRGAVEVPGVPMVQVWGGIFDGESIDQIQNLDEHFMYVGRVEVHPLGRGEKLAESDFTDQITIGAHVMQNTRDLDATHTEDDFGWGGDATAAWNGLYATVEYLQIDHRFPEGGTHAYHSNGWVAEASYLLPLADCWKKQLEVGARVEEIDRNDFVPVDNPGDGNQSLRYLTGNLSYYLRQHDIKVQASYAHIVEVEDKSRTGDDITFDNDTLLVQATLRME
jgi:hypothetical protein